MTALFTGVVLGVVAGLGEVWADHLPEVVGVSGCPRARGLLCVDGLRLGSGTGEDGGLGFLGDRGGMTVLASAARLRLCWARLAAMLAWSCCRLILAFGLTFWRMVVSRW